MNANEPGHLPNDLLQARSRFQTWRSHRPIGRQIPESFLTLGGKLVPRHGLNLTANVLGLDYYSRKKRTRETTSQLTSGQSPFI